MIGNLKTKQAYHSVIYDHNPNISDCRSLDKSKKIHLIDHHQLNRPYIDYTNSTKSKYIWNNNFKPTPGELYFNNEELTLANKIMQDAKTFWKDKHPNKDYHGKIFLETSSTKIDHKNWSLKHFNKDWSKQNWEKLIDKLKDYYLIIQSTHHKTIKNNHVFKTNKMNFRVACATMDLCDLYVGPEGGFSHVAGALNKSAVVYYGGWIDPNIIGYDFHTNIYYKNKNSPCGMYREKCNHCEEARNKISVEHFLKEINKIFF